MRGTIVVILLLGSVCAGDMFYDDFEDGDTNGWQLSSDGVWSIDSGVLVQNGPSSGDHVMGLVEDHTFSTQFIETEVKTPGYAGVVLWYQDPDHYISVSAYPSSAGLYINERNIDTLHYGQQTFHDTWYTLGVDADSTDGTLDIYLDDEYIFTYSASMPIRSGLSGVTSGNGGGYWDSFSAVPVPLPDAAILGILGLGAVGMGLRKKHTQNP